MWGIALRGGWSFRGHRCLWVLGVEGGDQNRAKYPRKQPFSGSQHDRKRRRATAQTSQNERKRAKAPKNFDPNRPNQSALRRGNSSKIGPCFDQNLVRANLMKLQKRPCPVSFVSVNNLRRCQSRNSGRACHCLLLHGLHPTNTVNTPNRPNPVKSILVVFGRFRSFSVVFGRLFIHSFIHSFIHIHFRVVSRSIVRPLSVVSRSFSGRFSVDCPAPRSFLGRFSVVSRSFLGQKSLKVRGHHGQSWSPWLLFLAVVPKSGGEGRGSGRIFWWARNKTLSLTAPDRKHRSASSIV